MNGIWNGESFDYIMGSGESWELTLDVAPVELFGPKWYWVPNEKVNSFKSELKQLGGKLQLNDNFMRLSFNGDVWSKIPEINAWVEAEIPGISFQYGYFQSHAGNWGYSGADKINPPPPQ